MTSSVKQMRINMLDTSKSDIESLMEMQEEKIFAIRGEENYDEAMDYNHDGVVTYDEYMRYCSENAVSQYSSSPSMIFVSKVQDGAGQIQSLRPLNFIKFDNYIHFGEEN